MPIFSVLDWISEKLEIGVTYFFIIITLFFSHVKYPKVISLTVQTVTPDDVFFLMSIKRPLLMSTGPQYKG